MKNLGGWGCLWATAALAGREAGRLTDAEMPRRCAVHAKTPSPTTDTWEAATYIFADGHAKWLRWEQTFEPIGCGVGPACFRLHPGEPETPIRIG